MAEYYKWYKSQQVDEYAFAIPITEQDRVVTITIIFDNWQIETTYLPPPRWREMTPIGSADRKTIDHILKGQKGKIITQIFALRL